MKTRTIAPARLVLATFVALFAWPGSDARSDVIEKRSDELMARLESGELGFRRLVLVQRHSIEPSHVYTYHNEGFRPGGGLYVWRPDADGDALEKLVASPDGQILDCELSYDGREILFSWRRSASDAYQVYSVGADGSNPRSLTAGPSHNFNACWLPDGGIAFLSTRKPAFAYCWTSPVGVLHRMERDGTRVRRLSANYLNDFTPSVTNDGQIIYGRWEYVDRPAIPIQSLWTLRPDGTRLSVFYGNRVLSPATLIEPRSIPGTSKVLCTLTAHNGPCRGAIGIIDPTHGVNAQASIRNLTPEVDIGRVDKGSGNRVRGPYESPYPLDEKYFLVSRRGTILLRDYDATAQVELITPRDGMGFYSPRPLRPRRRPPVRPSSLPVGATATATVHLQDVYVGLEPHVRRGEVKQICVVQEIEKSEFADVKHRAFGFQFPVVSCGATYAPKKVWGYASVAADGSASFEVPAGLPLYFMALDAYGRAVQRMRSFTHFMPGEEQGCVGCHASRNEIAPARSDSPELSRRPQELTPPEWGVEGFSYSRIVQPVLDRYCVRCHNAYEAPGGVDLSGDKTDFFNVSYEILARQGRPGANPYTKWIPTFNGHEANILAVTPRTWGSPASRLAELILAGHPDEGGEPRIEMDDASRRRVFAWIDLNVPYYGTSRSNYPERDGCRRMVPPKLDAVLQEVARRRCASCHAADKSGNVRLPRKPWLRVSRPEWNSFLLAPLARAAGGTQACGEAVFRSTEDKDYRTILDTFRPLLQMLEETPRMDMVAARKARAPRRVGKAVRAGVEADWIERDRRRGGGFALAHTREVIERARQLASRLSLGSRSPVRRLERVAADLERLEKAEDVTVQERRALYLAACRAAREIAFSNPLLDFDRLLFIKRHDAGGVYHMCDQYYGCNARPGGGLYVLSDPFGPEPELIDVLEDSVVMSGRLQGQKLDSGSFLSPELSYDGEKILFAYSEAKAERTYQWAPEFSYHIFSVNADGTRLRQLTDGKWDDFDPCFLPNGRIAFVSERRGGYLRCGRHCPVYTLHSMAPDGSDIRRLSFHETHEWHPSVDNDGMIVYTRWDYVDRDTNIAHHIWTCFPDGRDPRSFHGNYPERRESRPWMEMSIRAVPGSPKYVATAAAHHGHAFGSLVLIDPRPEDDGAMSQLERLTPEVGFPEAEGGKGSIRGQAAYATPWPLGEDDYLCAYDADSENHGLYWIDRFGNKELIYRDRAIPCLSPIPLRARRKPPVIPEQTQSGVAEAARRPATVAVLNVYDSEFDWPDGTVIKALRVIQLLPKSTAPPNEPRIGIANQTNARAVLGTVPVEADGSAFFEAPPGKPLYFQAVDGHGMAVQSMRSATYLHPGERLTCRGCHERKRRASPVSTTVPTALQRAPSKIRPDVAGSNPFSFVRLVQPVLDRNCVGCHEREKALDLRGVIEGPQGWTRSYRNLAGKYGFYFHVSNGSIHTGVHGGSRTTPGQFGARAAELLGYLDEEHHGVTLSREDFHRLTLWLDCNSEFYGAYENTAAQSRGEVVRPTLE